MIITTNVQTDLLTKLGLEIVVNENSKNGKIKKVAGVNLIFPTIPGRNLEAGGNGRMRSYESRSENRKPLR